MKFAGALVIGLALISLNLSAAAQEKRTLVIASYGGSYQDAQRKAFFEPFEKETGIKVVDATGATGAKVKAMVLGGNPEWDVFATDSADFLALSRAGLLEKIDYKAMDPKTVAELNPQIVKEYGVGSVFYSQVIVYNTRKFSKDHHPVTWADVWDVEKFPGTRVLPSGNYLVRPIEFALLADGVDPKHLYPLDLERAYRSLSRIRPNVVKWVNTAQAAPQALVDGEADVGFSSYGRVADLRARGAAIDFGWEGALITADYWAIPKGTKNYDIAMKFIEFASRADRIAELVKQLPYGPVNTKTFDLLTPEQQQLLPTYPANLEKQILLQPEWWAEVDASGKSNIEKNLDMWNAWILQK
jgi:putative spermidine/putrescine transport system substrate-binding protein